MIVYKIVYQKDAAADMVSAYIRGPSWKITYRFGEIARGRPRPGRHRTPIFCYPSLEDARACVLSCVHQKILRCWAPSGRPSRQWACAGVSGAEADERCLTEFWFTRCNNWSMVRRRPLFTVPYLIPLEVVQ